MPKIHPDDTPKEPQKLGSPQEEAQPQAENAADQQEAELAITRVVEEQQPESSD